MTHRPYNNTFNYYCASGMIEKMANDYVKYHNQFNGGVWMVHTHKQYAAWCKANKIDLKNQRHVIVLPPLTRDDGQDFNDNGVVFNPWTKANETVER